MSCLSNLVLEHALKYCNAFSVSSRQCAILGISIAPTVDQFVDWRRLPRSGRTLPWIYDVVTYWLIIISDSSYVHCHQYAMLVTLTFLHRSHTHFQAGCDSLPSDIIFNTPSAVPKTAARYTPPAPTIPSSALSLHKIFY